MKELELSLETDAKGLLQGLIDAPAGIDYSEVHHASFGREGDSLINIARREETVKQLIVQFAMQGFYVYRKTDTSTRLVKDHTISKLWHRVRNGEYTVGPEGLIYSYTPPITDSPVPKLLVIFSSMSTSIYDTSMMRYFEQNFRSAQKYIPHDTGVLRIADIGGVVGAFYLNTHRNPQNVVRVQNLLNRVRTEHGIPSDNVILYGASKGGTGALFHGITGGYRFIAVDPIVSDAYYVHKYRDSHFTMGGIFERSKDVVFSELVKNCSDHTSFGSGTRAAGSVIYSERSPQYSAVTQILAEPLVNRIAFFNSRHPGINDHPDVSPKTLNLATMLMNIFFLNEDLRPGLRLVP
ncbi:XcbB/CpsF family capsular polysaccharide biosynthesis protein [Arthrobacter sp. CAN_A1]|uniref:XcbB/CpsF family capsular polysaccharide biosynthesis protein n=1 Tax=Arthrobacter sp. CAN_A1 TaxID=2787717 RepID=UPI0018CAB01D